MIRPTFEEFKRLSRQGNVIPVFREVLADMETPVSAFLKMDTGPYAYLLESVEAQENIGRYSFLASRPSLVFQSKGTQITRLDLEGGRLRSRVSPCRGTPIAELKKLISGFAFVAVAGLPRFCGGFVGYMGYDMVRFAEKIPDKNPDELKLPDCVFMLSKDLVIFDHVDRKIKLVSSAILSSKDARHLKKTYEGCRASIDKMAALLNRRSPAPRKNRAPKKRGRLGIASNVTKTEFRKAVGRAKEYIRRGDVIQVVLSQRFSMKLADEPFDIYRSLRSVNPSPYMFYMKLDGLTLIGSSPELLVRCEDGVVETRPIAGTRPRGRTPAEDEALERSLLSDAKEKAEHLMLVDLGRNDLGRVCVPGSVRVTDFMSVEKYSHVMHIVSNVTGRLRRDCDALDALVACFPAGTVAGAPKVRAMEIIDELERTRRGPYAGALGYFSFSGNLDSCIIIRTIVVKDKRLYIQAGAGIVSDSVPEREYEETVNKARALFEAVRRVDEAR